MKTWDSVVVGGGPSGMMAAGRAAERGRSVLLIERNRHLGSKLLISGKGRCNLTNDADRDLFIEEFGPSGRFLYNAFARFFNTDLIDFFEKRKLRLKVERGGRIFPGTDDARDVVKVLHAYLGENGVVIHYDTTVRDVLVSGKNVSGVRTSAGKDIYSSQVVLATGGLSYPQTGSTGIGHGIAKKLGHTVIAPKPALVPIEVREGLAKKWQGVSLKNVSCAVYSDAERVDSRFGEMLFTHFGLSGPIILDLSKVAGNLLMSRKKVSVHINFKPALSREKLDARLLREFSENPNKSLVNILSRLLPARLVAGFLKTSVVDETKRANQISRSERLRLVDTMMDFAFTVTKTRPIEEAIVTAGGVAVKEIDPQTMESRLIKGLYIVGELIDIDAGTGGYNLQAAFSTGYVCGDNL